MPFSGGVYTRDHTWVSDANAGIKIRADIHDTHDQDLATAINLMICKDGQTSPTADINWGNKKITNLAPGVAATDVVNKSQLDGLRTFGSAITVSGSFPESLIKFSGPTGPWGLSFTAPADMFFGVKVDTWVWNDKADASGTDVMVLTKPGVLTLLNKGTGGAGYPVVKLNRDEAVPNATIIGQLAYYAKNSAAASVMFADDFAQVVNRISGSEDATRYFRTMIAGTMTNRLALASNGITVFDQLAVQGVIISSQSYTTSINNIVIGPGTTGVMYFRPSGYTNVAKQMSLSNNGNLSVDGDVIASGGANISGVVTGNAFSGPGAAVMLGPATAGTVYLRPNGTGSATKQATIASSGAMVVDGDITASGSAVIGLSLSALNGNCVVNGNLVMSGGATNPGSTNALTIASGLIDSSKSVNTASSHHRFFNPTGMAGAINTTNNTTAYVTSSDENFKAVKGTADQQSAIDIIRADPVLTWTWKTTGVEDIGWVAQKSYAVDPNLACPPPEPTESEGKPAYGEDGYVPWGIDYGRRTPYLWAALTWALDQIDDLRARLETLEGAPA